MTIFVNESELTLEPPANIIRVLTAIDLKPDRRGIAVAVNDEVVRRAEWTDYIVSEGDRVEVIQATQGG